MENISIKRGDTFKVKCSIPLAFGNTLTGVTAQLRRNQTLIESLSYSVLAPTVTDFVYQLAATKEQTALWPVCELLCDIQYAVGADAASTATFSVTVNEDVTR